MTPIAAVPPPPYCGPAPAPGALWHSWNLDPPLLTGLAALLVWGTVRARRQGGGGAFAVFWLALAVAFVSPLCALTAALFSARAAHHLVLLGIAAPALALARPWRGAPAAPVFCALAAALVLWHLPGVYSAVWRSDALYAAMQAALLLPAWGLWSALLAPRDGMALMPVGLVAGLAALMGLIGAVLTFAPVPLYAEHVLLAALWDLDPLADQQLAGLVMWVPGMIPLAGAAALAARRAWLRDAQT